MKFLFLPQITLTKQKSFLNPSYSIMYQSKLHSLYNHPIQRIKYLSKKHPEKPILRIFVDSGGCSGFQYVFEMVSSSQQHDRVQKFQEDVKIAIDVESLEYIQGSTIDFESQMIRQSFAVISNPNADLSCSCGTSFSVKNQ